MTIPYLDNASRPVTLPKLPKVPGPTDVNAPITTGVPLGLGDIGGGQVPFSNTATPPGDVTGKPVSTQPMTPTVPAVSPQSTTDPMAFANSSPRNPTPTTSPPPPPIAPGAAPVGPPPPPPGRPAWLPASIDPNAISAAGVRGGTGSAADTPGGTVSTDPTNGIRMQAGRYTDLAGNDLGKVGDLPAGLVRLRDGRLVTFTPGTQPGVTDQTPFTPTMLGNHPIAGGNADSIHSYEQMFGGEEALQKLIGSDPNRTLGSLADSGAYTGDQLVQMMTDSGFGYEMTGDQDWWNRLIGEQTPQNIKFNAPIGEDPTARNSGATLDGTSNTWYPIDRNMQGGTALTNSTYIDRATGKPTGTIEDSANGIDPVTHQRLAPLTDGPPSGNRTSGTNPNAARLTDGTTPSAPPLAPGGPAGGRPGSTPTMPGTTPGAPLPPRLPTLPTTGSIGPAGGAGNAGGIPIGPASGAQTPPTTGTTATGAAGPTTPGPIPIDPATTLPPVNPDNSLLSKVITPGNSVDRFKLAQDSFNADVAATDPAYQATLRDTNRYNFGRGRGVSGMATNSIGDIATQREKSLDAMRTNYLNTALTGSIDDMYRNLGIETQQQGFQKSLADTAFDQSVTGAQLNDSLTNSDFGRWLASQGFARDTQAQGFNQAMSKAQLEEFLTNGAYNRASGNQQAGYANNPSDIMMILSQIFGSQSSAAAKAAAESFGNAGRSSGTSSGGGSTTDAFLQWLMSQYKKGGSAPPVTTTDQGGYPWENP